MSVFAPWLGPALLVAARVSGLVGTAPSWGAPGVSWRVRVGLVGLLTALVLPLVGPKLRGPESGGHDLTALAWPLACEGIVGAALGMTLGLVLAAARQAGELVGAQAGVSSVAVVELESSAELTPWGHLYGLVALGVFLAVDGPVRVVSALVESYEAVPVGALTMQGPGVIACVGRVGWALWLALRAAAPVLVALVGASVLLGWTSRALAGLALDTVTTCARCVLGLVLVLAGLGAVAAVMTGAWVELLP